MGRIIDTLDSTQRCMICRRFYHSPNGKSEQLPVFRTNHGLMCQRCIGEILWLDFRHKGTDPIIAYLGKEDE